MQAERRRLAWFEERVGASSSFASAKPSGSGSCAAAGALSSAALPLCSATSSATGTHNTWHIHAATSGAQKRNLSAAITCGPTPPPEQAGAQAMEAFLAQEIESHTCPICYELMLAPKRAPCLLFPCGHTFCSSCLQRSTQQTSTQSRHVPTSLCPYCREPVEKQAVNVALQQLICAFAAQRDAHTATLSQRRQQALSEVRDEPQAAHDAASTEEDRCSTPILGTYQFVCPDRCVAICRQVIVCSSALQRWRKCQ